MKHPPLRAFDTLQFLGLLITIKRSSYRKMWQTKSELQVPCILRVLCSHGESRVHSCILIYHYKTWVLLIKGWFHRICGISTFLNESKKWNCITIIHEIDGLHDRLAWSVNCRLLLVLRDFFLLIPSQSLNCQLRCLEGCNVTDWRKMRPCTVGTTLNEPKAPFDESILLSKEYSWLCTMFQSYLGLPQPMRFVFPRFRLSLSIL